MLGGLNTSRNRVGFAYVSRYNPYQTYGNGEDADRGKYYIRWLKYGDSADTSVVFKILLDKAATAGDTFQVVFTTENGSYGNDWSWTCDTATTGSTTATVTLSAGQTEVNFTMIAEVAGNQWRPNRIVTATLQSPSARLSIDPDREVQKLALIPAQDPPKIRISTAETGFSVATGGSQLKVYTLTLNKSAPLEVPQRVILQGPLAPYCTVSTSPINAGSAVRNNGITCDVDAAVTAGLGVGDGVSVLLDYERSEVAFTETDWNPASEHFAVPQTNPTNLFDPETEWTVGTGSVGNWTALSGAGENSRESDTNPHGDTAVIWKAINADSAGNAYDGGYLTPQYSGTVDPTKTYRTSFWFKYPSNASPYGNIRFQAMTVRSVIGGGTAGILLSEPINTFTANQWYLVVTTIHPYTYSGADTGTSGVYAMDGTKVYTIPETKWNDASDTNTRFYESHFNDPSDNNEEVWFWDPRMDLVDGNEASIAHLLNPPVEMVRDVHADENLWHWTNDLVAGGTESGQLTPQALEPHNLPLPKFAGLPTPMIYDGTKHEGDAAWKEGRGRPQAKVEEQDDASPVLDPVTGNALKIYCPDATATGMPYVRESFSKVFCGGPLTAHESRRHMRMSFVVQYMQGADAGRNMEFHRVGIRIREANRNHGAVFRSSVNMPDPLSDSRIGRDRYGNSTTVYGPFDGVKFWFWDYGYNMAPQDCGVVEDENGHARLWYRITMDPNVVYPPPSFTNVPDDTGIFCNPIQYPQWFLPTDGSNIRADGTTDRTITVDDIRDQRLGALWHSMQFEMSDTPLEGPPGRFWPKMSHNGWAPLGNASLENNATYDTSISLVLET